MNTDTALLTEHPLTQEDWSNLLAQDPIRALRRYHYQVSRCFQSSFSLFHSLQAFQQVTGRSPQQFLPKAQDLLPQAIDVPSTQAWSSISSSTTTTTNHYLNFVSPYTIFSSILTNASILRWQAQESAMPEFPATARRIRARLRTLSPRYISRILSGAKNRARLRAAWQDEIARLAIVLEETTRSDAMREVASAEFHSSLAPYPNEQEWLNLWNSNQQTARQQFFKIKQAQAQIGLSAAFELGESAAAFQAIVRTRSGLTDDKSAV